jgi:uncharacterized hydantoinase/oxoprolinase family protein
VTTDRLSAVLQNKNTVHVETVTELFQEKDELQKVINEYRSTTTSSAAAYVMTRELFDANTTLAKEDVEHKSKIHKQDDIITDLHDQLVKASDFATQQISMLEVSKKNEHKMSVENEIIREKMNRKAARLTQLQHELQDL